MRLAAIDGGSRPMLTREQLASRPQDPDPHQPPGDRSVRRAVPQRLQGARHRVRGGAALPARRRGAHDRLERDGADGHAAREALRRGARAHRDAARRRQRQHALRQRAADQGGAGGGAGRAARLLGHHEQRQGRPGDLLRPHREGGPAAQGHPARPAGDPRGIDAQARRPRHRRGRRRSSTCGESRGAAP